MYRERHNKSYIVQACLSMTFVEAAHFCLVLVEPGRNHDVRTTVKGRARGIGGDGRDVSAQGSQRTAHTHEARRAVQFVIGQLLRIISRGLGCQTGCTKG